MVMPPTPPARSWAFAVRAGLLLLPTLGIQNSIFLAPVDCTWPSVVGFWLLSQRLKAAARYGGIAMVVLSFGLLVWLVPPWTRN